MWVWACEVIHLRYVDVHAFALQCLSATKTKHFFLHYHMNINSFKFEKKVGWDCSHLSYWTLFYVLTYTMYGESIMIVTNSMMRL